MGIRPENKETVGGPKHVPRKEMDDGGKSEEWLCLDCASDDGEFCVDNATSGRTDGDIVGEHNELDI